MFKRPRKLPQPPEWGNRRKEFHGWTPRAPINSPIKIQSPIPDMLLPRSMDFSTKKEKTMVCDVHTHLGKKSLSMRYRTESGTETTRTVTPFIVTLIKGNWGFYALCQLRDAIRWFRFDRIVSVDPVPLVHELNPTELALRLAAMPEHMQHAVLDAIEILDPDMHKRVKSIKKKPNPELELASSLDTEVVVRTKKKPHSFADVGHKRVSAISKHRVNWISAHND